MKPEYLNGAEQQLFNILGSVAEFEDQLKMTLPADSASRSTVRSIQPGLSGAAVFLVRRVANGAPMVPLVAKVSSDEKLITAERANYKNYIESKFTSAPSLLQTESSKILFYVYGGFLAPFGSQTLRSGCASSDPCALAILMQRIVKVLHTLHHLASDTTSCADRLILNPPLNLCLDAVAETISPNSRDAILSLWDAVHKTRDSYPSMCMTGHGDLNAGNVLFEAGDDGSYPLFIDFASMERSKDNTNYPPGYHFPFWDYAKLERDLKTRLFLKEAIAEGLKIPEIVEAIRTLDSGQVHSPASTSASVGKLFKAVSALRESVREKYAPEIYSSAYGLAVAYATLSVLYRSQPDDDLPLGVQTLVAVESAISLLSRTPDTWASTSFKALRTLPGSGKDSTTVLHSDPIERSVSMNEPSRRVFLWAMGGFVTSQVAAGFLGRVGEGIWAITLDPVTLFPSNTDKELISFLFNSENLPKVYAGEGNKLAKSEGKLGLSSYLRNASETFNAFIPKAFGLEIIKKDSDDQVFAYNPHQSALFLGGPVANDETARLAHYRFEEIALDNGKTVRLPVFDKTLKQYRWGQLHGEKGFGVYVNKKTGVSERRTAKRYDGGNLVERPIYALVDLSTNTEIFPSIENGFLKNEWLTIIKRVENKRSKVIIGGLHGYSSEAFARDIDKNLEKLKSMVGNKNEFQIIIPVHLDHTKALDGRWYTSGALVWEESQVHEIT